MVVDNGDESALMAQVKQHFPTVDIVRSEHNVGFAAGMNIGLRLALERGFETAWILNNDTLVRPEALNSLSEAALHHSGNHLFSPLILDGQGGTWFAGGRINWRRMRTEHRHVAPTSLAPFRTEFLTGCALFVPRATLERIGLLDERYFLYYEDADYSTRVLAKAGELWVVPQAVVVHHEVSETNPEKLYWLVRSGTTFFLSHTQGLAHFWILGYLKLRRAKNWLRRIFSPGPVAEKLERAYTDALMPRS